MANIQKRFYSILLPIEQTFQRNKTYLHKHCFRAHSLGKSNALWMFVTFIAEPTKATLFLFCFWLLVKGTSHFFGSYLLYKLFSSIGFGLLLFFFTFNYVSVVCLFICCSSLIAFFYLILSHCTNVWFRKQQAQAPHSKVFLVTSRQTTGVVLEFQRLQLCLKFCIVLYIFSPFYLYYYVEKEDKKKYLKYV